MAEKISTFEGLERYIERTAKGQDIISCKTFDYSGNKLYWNDWNREMNERIAKCPYSLKELFRN